MVVNVRAVETVDSIACSASLFPEAEKYREWTASLDPLSPTSYHPAPAPMASGPDLQSLD